VHDNAEKAKREQWNTKRNAYHFWNPTPLPSAAAMPPLSFFLSFGGNFGFFLHRRQMSVHMHGWMGWLTTLAESMWTINPSPLPPQKRQKEKSARTADSKVAIWHMHATYAIIYLQ
jgi:hypothetical protein